MSHALQPATGESDDFEKREIDLQLTQLIDALAREAAQRDYGSSVPSSESAP
jgi:hypothetical protein